MFTEDQLLPISALQHLLFCERQCALIHIEQLWADNRWTIEGSILHEKSDSESSETQGDLRIARSLPLRSLVHGLVGFADVVEFQGDSVAPVEFKRGRPKQKDSDRVQLCAQALCLEEMTGKTIQHGFLFYHQRKRRTRVPIDATLRATTHQAIERLRELIDTQQTPPAQRAPHCDTCSLINLCLPDATHAQRSASRFMTRQFNQHLQSETNP